MGSGRWGSVEDVVMAGNAVVSVGSTLIVPVLESRRLCRIQEYP